MKYVVYGFAACQYCKEAQRLLSERWLPFDAVYIESREERQKWLDDRGLEPPNRLWPRIVRVNDDGSEDMIGGYTDLAKLIA